MSWNIIEGVNSWGEFRWAMAPLRPDERGKAFELLTEFFLQIDPTYLTKLKNVWHEGNLPPDVRHKLDLPSTDLGVDLVAETHQGEFWAIQCKYHHDPKKNLRKTELDSFLNLTRQHCSGKFSTLLAVTSAHGYSHNITKIAPEVQFILSDEFQSLNREFFEKVREFVQGMTKKPDKRKPRPHQKTAIENAVRHFKNEGNTRGKLVHPCGTGKSLIGFWISEALETKTTLVALPSLYLVRQTLNDWTRESLALGNTIDWRVVCSESTIGETDKGDPAMRFQEIGVDVISDTDSIVAFLRKRGKGPKVIFTTYQSGRVVAEAARKANRILDVGIFDEAHRTVGQADSLFSHLLDESNIRIRKRIFMTATERRYQGSSDTILSMDDVDAYGETFDKMTFKEALEQENPILSDYKIVTTVVGKSEIQHLIDENFLVKPDKGKWDDDTEARTLAALIALRKVMKKHEAKHALSFHNSISKAEAFKASQEKFNEAGKGFGKVDCFHVSSKVSTGERKAELERFRLSENAIITNAKCLTEGVDVPTIDAVLFADTKSSTVDIVQAAGRALRRSDGKRIGYIIIPVLVDENDPEATDKAFQDILMTLRAMASNDDRIIDYFRSISQGKRPTKSDSIVDFEVPDPVKIRLEDFIENVETQVWHRLAKISWRPFEEAREFVRGLGIVSKAEWQVFTKTEQMPSDIPVGPSRIYKSKGWTSWGDWLGTGTIAPQHREYRPFEEAREFVRNLKLKDRKEWNAFAKTDKRPADIPAYPNDVYRDEGWKGVGDWLGTGSIASFLRRYRSFEDARQFVHKLNLKNESEWKAFTKTDQMPEDIPNAPWYKYKDEGWNGMGDWLGTRSVATHLREYLPFEEAREFARSLNLKSQKEWRTFAKSCRKPDDIPTNPNVVYKNQGWKGLGDWLGTGNVAPSLKEYRSFEEAREFARSLKLKSGAEWRAFTKTEHMPADIPKAPDHRYKEEGWRGYGDWLGTGTIAAQLRKYRSFEEAREFARSLKLKSGAEWRAFTKTKHVPADIPTSPNVIYKDKGWNGMGDWLGTGTIAPQLREYRSFEAAREFARSLKLRNGAEWKNFAKTDEMPADIPAYPDNYYKDKGWKGYGDWLGTGNVANFLRKYRPFVEAREFTRSLKLKNRKEWITFKESEKLPSDIPATPERIYKDEGWNGLGDWLGTGRVANQSKNYRPFAAAREFARSLKLKNGAEWQAFAKTTDMPEDIPAYPDSYYKEKGWAGFGDWLGTGAVAPSEREFLPFEEARDFARRLKFKNRAEWKAFTKTQQLPPDIPTDPSRPYKGKGWAGWGDWLGTGRVSTHSREHRPFKEARGFVRSLSLRNREEWNTFTKTERMPADIPAGPSRVYKDHGWAGWGDWLGTGTIAPQLREFRPFEEAREFARSLKLKSKVEWSAFAKSNRRPKDIPSNPNLGYKNKGWKGFKDWLGNE